MNTKVLAFTFNFTPSTSTPSAMQTIQRIVRYLIPIGIVLILTLPIVLQYIFKWAFFQVDENFYIGVYTLYMFLYLIIQVVFAHLNASKQKYAEKDGDEDPEHDQKRINLCVVGYREHPDYFKMCLESVKKTIESTPNFNRLYVVVDGQDSEDMYMMSIFKEIFTQSSKHIDIPQLPSTTNKANDIESGNWMNELMGQINDFKYVCVTQPHAGKRHGLYTAMKMSSLEQQTNKVKSIFCTDSDTVLDNQVANELYKCLRYSNVGAASGVLEILNKYNTFVSFLVSVRYWFAFYVERGYQSFNKCVLCVSGPMGMYKLECIEPKLDEWVNQTYLGKECTYGDDRHLTNKILEQGKHIVFNPNAYGLTETPDTLYRFYKQQVRWAKSSFREFGWNVKSIDRQSVFMTLDLTYQFFYSFAVIVLLIYGFFVGTFFTLGLYFISVIGVGLLKGVYALYKTGKVEYLFYSNYFFLFLGLLLPARLYAMISMYDISWGTSERKIIKSNYGLDFVFWVFWVLCITALFVYNVYTNAITNTRDYLWLVIPLAGSVVLYVIMFFFMLYIKAQTQPTDLQINEEEWIEVNVMGGLTERANEATANE